MAVKMVEKMGIGKALLRVVSRVDLSVDWMVGQMAVVMVFCLAASMVERKVG